MKTLTLTEFILARILEDEVKVDYMTHESERVATAPIFQSMPRDWLTGVDIFVSPARWRAECLAKRAIVERAYELMPHAVVEDCWYTCPAATEDRDGGECCDDARRGTGCDCGSDMRIGLLLRLLAAPYAAHPDFRSEWAA